MGIPQDSHLQKKNCQQAHQLSTDFFIDIEFFKQDPNKFVLEIIAFHTIGTILAHVAKQAGHLSLWLCLCSG